MYLYYAHSFENSNKLLIVKKNGIIYIINEHDSVMFSLLIVPTVPRTSAHF